jgi:hypothetical protein
VKRELMARVSPVLPASCLLVMSASGCGTSQQVKQLQLAQLRSADAETVALLNHFKSGELPPRKFDIYLFINKSLLDNVLAHANGLTLQLARPRNTVLRIGSLSTAFVGGHPELAVLATASNPDRHLAVTVAIDAHLDLVADPTQPDTLQARVVIENVVPNIRWGFFEIRKWRFSHDMATLELSRLAAQLPRFPIPISHDLTLATPAGKQTMTIPTGNGSSVTGEIHYPGVGVFFTCRDSSGGSSGHLYRDLRLVVFICCRVLRAYSCRGTDRQAAWRRSPVCFQVCRMRGDRCS